MNHETKVTPIGLDDIARRFVMYALCILLPFLGIVYGLNLQRGASPGVTQRSQQALGRNLILAGVAGLAWWSSSCGILWLALMAVLKTINLVP